MNEDLPAEAVEAIKHFQERAEKAIVLEDLLKKIPSSLKELTLTIFLHLRHAPRFT